MKELCDKWGCIDICPETAGGMTSPRPRHEVVSEGRQRRVLSFSGEDHTKQFLRGAQEVLRFAKENGVKAAILKARSPSCGKGVIYSGKFDGSLTQGNGVTAELLIRNNIKVFTEEEIPEAEKFLEERLR